MANLILRKNLPNDPEITENIGYSWIVNNNRVWVTTTTKVFYSTDFGTTFIDVSQPSFESPSTLNRQIWGYRTDNETYVIVQTIFDMTWLKWDGVKFNEIHTITGTGSINNRFHATNGKVYFTMTIQIEQGVTDRLFIQQDGDIINIISAFTSQSILLLGIVEKDADIYFEHAALAGAAIFVFDGVNTTIASTHADLNAIRLTAFFDFEGDIYYYNGINKEIGTIILTTGVRTPISTLSDSITSGAFAYFREINTVLHFIVGERAIDASPSRGVRTYEFNGFTFTKVDEFLERALGDAIPEGLDLFVGLDNNEIFESECTIVYIGVTSTNETAIGADDGTITHDVNTTNAVGVVNYRLLDINEIEVVTWQESPIFTSLIPQSYILESRDDKCIIRFNQVIGVLSFQTDPNEQQASRSRDYLNSPNLTRFYQIFGLTLNDFQDLDGELPEPIDVVTGQVPVAVDLRITTAGDQRVTSGGSRRKVSD